MGLNCDKNCEPILPEIDTRFFKNIMRKSKQELR